MSLSSWCVLISALLVAYLEVICFQPMGLPGGRTPFLGSRLHCLSQRWVCWSTSAAQVSIGLGAGVGQLWSVALRLGSFTLL